MNDPKRIDDLEQKYEELKSEMNANLTMVIGQGWKHGENLRLHRNEMSERLERIDGRIDGLHRDVAELEIAMKDVKKTQDDHSELLREILSRLPEKEE